MNNALPPKRRRSLLKRIVKGVLVGVLLALVGIGATAWHLLHKYSDPVAYKPETPLSAFAQESAPATVTPFHEPPFDWSQIATPPQAAGPWARWWWPGNDVDSDELKKELADLRDANFAGVEVQPFLMGTAEPIKAVPEAKAQVHSVDTPTYYQHLHDTLKAAEQLGMQVDLTNLSGWPAASGAATAAEGLQNLAWSTTTFSGGKRVDIELPRPSRNVTSILTPLIGWLLGEQKLVEWNPDAATLATVVVAHPLGGSHSLLNPKDSIRLDPNSLTVVDAHVIGGRLQWHAPAGEWMAVASWLMPAGQPPLGSAALHPGYVTDMLRADIVRSQLNYAYGKRTGLEPFYGGPLRGFFSDSFEVQGDRLSSADFFSEFEKRRGYDLHSYLPAAYRDGADSTYVGGFFGDFPPSFKLGPLDERIRSDYQQTLSDLIIERFIVNSREWAEARGLQSRMQAYGLDIDVIHALGENNIPEVEQLAGNGSQAFLRMGGAAAMLYGRTRVGSESFVWMKADGETTPTKLKAATDLLLLAGVNQIMYHGVAYDWRPGGKDKGLFSAIGWQPFAAPDAPMGFTFSEAHSPRHPAWSDIATLNRYIARSQNLLRQGGQAADVLVYYPFVGYPDGGDSTELLHDGKFPLTAPAQAENSVLADTSNRPKERWLRAVYPSLVALERQGLTWTWVNGDAIQHKLQAGGTIANAPGRWSSVLFAQIESLPLETLQAAQALSTQGKSIFVQGGAPTRDITFKDADSRDAQVKALGAELAASNPLPEQPEAFANAVIEQIKPALKYAAPSSVRRHERVLADGARIDFLTNASDTPQSTSVLTTPAENAWWFDAANGQTAPAQPDALGVLTLTLKAFESRFLVRGVARPAALASDTALFAAIEAGQFPIESVSLTVGSNTRDNGLFDWRADEALRYNAEPAHYRASFTLPERNPDARYVLSTGVITGTAKVFVNGHDAGSAALPPWEVEITPYLVDGANAIDVVYEQPLRNRFVGAALAGDKTLAQFKKRKDQLVPAGLRGPFSVVEYVPAVSRTPFLIRK